MSLFPSSESGWERFATIGTWMVVSGVILEIPEIVEKARAWYLGSLWKKARDENMAHFNRMKLDGYDFLVRADIHPILPLTTPLYSLFSSVAFRLEHWKRITGLTDAVGWVLVVLGLVMELNGSQNVKKLDDAANAKLNVLASNIGTTNAWLVESNISSARQVEELRKANDEVEAGLHSTYQERIIPWITTSKPPELLTRFRGLQYTLFNTSDETSTYLGWQIRYMLNQAGWHEYDRGLPYWANGIGPLEPERIDDGVCIDFSPLGNGFGPSIDKLRGDALMTVLTNIGIITKETHKGAGFVITVGPNPSPFKKAK